MSSEKKWLLNINGSPQFVSDDLSIIIDTENKFIEKMSLTNITDKIVVDRNYTENVRETTIYVIHKNYPTVYDNIIGKIKSIEIPYLKSA